MEVGNTIEEFAIFTFPIKQPKYNKDPCFIAAATKLINYQEIIIANSQGMKPRFHKPQTQSTSNLKNSKNESRGKIYVPISASEKLSEKAAEERLSEGQNSNPSIAMIELRKANSELKEKQEVYIDKLIKLEEGLERQHIEFMQLQDLYNQLFSSYKQKQEEIAELQQRYRESNRKKQASNLQPLQHYQSVETQLKREISELKETIAKLEASSAAYTRKIGDLEKNIDKLNSEVAYYKSKDKMNDSRASLNTKVFEELNQWQRQADVEKEEKIKLQYENKFLKSRHDDLENRVVWLEEIIKQKQAEVLKLKQNTIMLSRSNSENRLLRSASRSPVKGADKQNGDKLYESIPKISSRVVEQLYEQNKVLKKQLDSLKTKIQNAVPSPRDHYIRQQQFFSFSRDQPYSNHSSNQENNTKPNNQPSIVKAQDYYQITQQRGSSRHSPKKQQHFVHFADNSELQELPPELDIDSLIQNSRRRQHIQA